MSKFFSSLQHRDKLIAHIRENVSEKVEHLQGTEQKLKSLVAGGENLISISDDVIKVKPLSLWHKLTHTK